MLKMEDIARLSGVSRQTVSAVLNGKAWVSAKTREKVLDVIARHNYIPNSHALSLAGKSSRLIGVILRDISNPFFNHIILGIEEVLRDAGYSLLYCNTFEDHNREVRAVKELLSYHAEGFIISPVLLGVDLSHLWHLHSQGRPVVSIESIPGMPVSSISFANERAAARATRYLIECGHRRIAFLTGPETSVAAAERLRGYRHALDEAGLSSARLEAPAGLRLDERLEGARALLSLPKRQRPTAILCFNDMTAMSVYQAAHGAGLSIPQDVSVVGFDNVDLSALLAPALTTVSLRPQSVGRRAAELLLERVEAKDKTAIAPMQEVLDPELVIRDSVRKI